MLDTTGIRAEQGEYEVSRFSELEVYPSRFNLKTGEEKDRFYLFDVNGEQINGSKAILNREKFQVTIDSRGFYCQLSVPKYSRGSNYKPATAAETKEVFKDLEKSLRDEGIKLNVLNTIPVRLDACKNIITELGTGNYFSFLPSLGGSRLNKTSGYSQGIKRTGFQWSNTQQEIVCYDKRVEMQHRKEKLTGIPKNCLRFEHRLRNGRKIKSALGFYSVENLINNYGLIEENYNNVLKQSIFKYGPNDNRLFQSRTIADYLEHSLTNYTRNKFLNFASNILFSKEGFLFDEVTLFETLEQVLEKLEYSSGKKRKQRYLLRKTLNERKKVYSTNETVNVRELYGELRTKLLKAA